MKKLFFFIFLLNGRLFGQQLYPIKESYDNLDNFYSYQDGRDYTVPANRPECFFSWGFTLHSYLVMYETTKDKAYLNKFVKHAYSLQTLRGTSDFPYWSFENYSNPLCSGSACKRSNEFLYGGLLFRAMAEYIYLVKSDNSLYNTNLLPGLIPSTFNGYPYTFVGYGDFANFLQARTVESLDYYIQNNWINDNDCFSKIPGGNNPIEINFNSSYAAAMFFIGNVDPVNHSDYTQKAEQIVLFFRNRVTEYTTNTNQSYTWFHDDTNPFREDVSHGGIDIQIPLVAYQLYGNGLYQPSEMNKFAHSLTLNIWDRYNNVFHNNVFGLDGDLSGGNDPSSTACGNPSNGTQNIYGPGEILTWMALYPFDDNNAAPDDIYTVLITQAVKLLNDDLTAILPSAYWNCHSSTKGLSGAQSFQGLSEVVKAQWDKECINLTLYNRDVVYNQDFIVKNKLMIAPEQVDDFHQLNGNSFADPITTNNTFLIESGKTVNMVAGESIQFLSGFVATTGSNFRASINPSACADGRMYTANQNNDKGNLSSSLPIDASTKIIGQQAKIKNEVTTSATITNNISISPNPNNGTFKITVTENNNPIAVKELKVYDLMGKVIWQTGASSYNEFDVDITNYSQGIYYVRSVNEDGVIEVKKLVKQ